MAPTRPGGAPGTAAVVSVAAVLADTAEIPKTTVARQAPATAVERPAPMARNPAPASHGDTG